MFQVWSSLLKGEHSSCRDGTQPAKEGMATRTDEFREDKLFLACYSILKYMTIHTIDLAPLAVGGLEIDD